MKPPFGFGKESGPNGPPKGYAPFGNSTPSHPYSSRLEHSPFNENRPASSITALQPQNQLQPQSKAISPLSEPVQSVNLIHPTNHQRPSPSVRYTIGHDAETKFPIKPSNFLVSHSNRSPSLPSQDNHFVQNYHSSTTNTKRSVTNMDMKHLNGTAETTKLVHPPPLPLQKYLQAQNLNVPPQGAERYDVPSITWDNQKKSPGRAVYPPHESMHSVKSHSNVHDGGTVSPIRPSYLTTFGRISSPPSGDASLFVPSARVDPERFDMSSSQRKSPVVGSGSPPQRSAPAELHSDSYGGGTTSPLKPAQFNGPKRARSPPLQSANVPLDAASAQINCEREMEAKAKRLARFNAELSRPLPRQENLMMQRSSDSNEAVAGKLFVNSPAEDVRASGEVVLSDYEGLETSDPVTGLCPDMCPEPEREERERKGDLDKYERLNGERNQTSIYLAVKKYNRTAERDAELIRPMPVLQKTMDYLLNMLDQPYSDNFLGIYNFLWDRMRAIRMDLRMQHLFNQDAITMLEQMIRFHIAAMHELCEYKKGEGFSEGFDAHLNIEQMNKASVELFQMYDDHRKKGKDVPTEREFRGYYALLKLDRHPGYKVEPAELSLDLAKMSPEMRCSPEILFARDVARACRTGNYIAFFRLANKATYLQACLMHAHFGKIRTQALASLHSSLQNNQGIPVQNVVRWLGMEGEDIETLLEYQGFMLKKYEEIYMVKIGTFLNSDVDCPTKCSELVHQKKSQRIINDVYSGQPIMSLNEEKGGSLAMVNLVDQQAKSSMETLPSVLDEEMLDYKVEPNPVVVTQQLVKGSAPVNVNSENEDKIVETSHASTSPVLMDAFTGNALQPDEDLVDESDAFVPREETTLPILNGNQIQARPLGRSTISYLENSEPAIAFARGVDKEASIPTLDQKDKVSNGKLKEIIRKWKQHTLFQREIREQKLILADIALSSLSLGPPLHQIEAQPCRATGDLNIDHVRMERYRRQSKSWTQLNVSELVAAILSARNPDAQCICWKVVVYVQENDTNNITHNLASKWLLSKLLGTSTEDNPELVVTSPDFSIWKKWIRNQTNSQQICCLSVVRKAIIGKVESCSDAITAGMCCAVFLVSEAIPWETQRNRLHDLLESIPSGSSLPLLVVNGDVQIGNITDSSLMVIKRLGLDDVDNTRINCSSVVFLGGNSAQEQLNYFFEDDQLREGLRWLADYSPLQPALRLVNIRELVLNYLRCSIEALKNLNPSEVGPEHCISALNAALDRAAEEILAAASSSPMHWPSPEIDLLEMSSNERIAAGMVLPSIGWNSARRIHSLIASLKDCRLPCFAAELSWLKQGAYMAQQIKNQKLALEDCLINYLVQSSRLLPGNLAAVEADVMLQKGTRIELQDPCYYVVPRWVVIFQRIYNWQLMKLALQELPDAYILDRCWESVPPVSGSNCGFQDTLESLSIDGDHVLHLLSSEPTFDEMFAVVCDTPLAQQPPMLGGSPQAMIQDPGQVSVIASGYGHHDDEEDFRRNESTSLVSPTEKRNQQEAAASAVKSPDKLTLLLRECHQLQDQIDEKLQIYF